MTNQIESVTNVVNVVTQSHITPQSVAYDFKEWMGVIGMIAASIYSAIHLVLPKVQAFCDGRDGGLIQRMFCAIFGKPKSESKPTS